MRIDEFFNKQPDIGFIDLLNQPMHECAPKNFCRTVGEAGEVSARGAYIAECYPDWRDIIRTATDDLETFLKVPRVHGDIYLHPLLPVCLG